MKLCEKCGKNIDDNFEYCPFCGSKSLVKSKNIVIEGHIAEQNSKYIRAEQLYKIGETVEALNLFVEYTEEFPKDWQVQIKVADICEELLKIYGPIELKLKKATKVARILDYVNQIGDGNYVDTVGKYDINSGSYAYCVNLRERMLKLARINAPDNIKLIIDDRLHNVVITPESGVVKKSDLEKAQKQKTNSVGENNNQKDQNLLRTIFLFCSIGLAIFGMMLFVAGIFTETVSITFASLFIFILSAIGFFISKKNNKKNTQK